MVPRPRTYRRDDPISYKVHVSCRTGVKDRKKWRWSVMCQLRRNLQTSHERVLIRTCCWYVGGIFRGIVSLGWGIFFFKNDCWCSLSVRDLGISFISDPQAAYFNGVSSTATTVISAGSIGLSSAGMIVFPWSSSVPTTSTTTWCIRIRPSAWWKILSKEGCVLVVYLPSIPLFRQAFFLQ